MRIAVLSGKGGTGKTFVSVNLAAAFENAVYIDCDVEEPNGRLFFKPNLIEKSSVSVQLPVFDNAKCIGCRKCVEFCRFNALAFVGGKPKLFDEVCHSCGGCLLVCESGAIREEESVIGFVEKGVFGKTHIITGELNIGEASGVPVIREALSSGYALNAETVVIDCPPGSACSVTESIADADYCLFVAEPTVFGLHNLKMVAKLSSLMDKPCGVIINKYDGCFEPLEVFCAESGIEIIAKIPYSIEIARIVSSGRLASEESSAIRALFNEIRNRLGGAI